MHMTSMSWQIPLKSPTNHTEPGMIFTSPMNPRHSHAELKTQRTQSKKNCTLQLHIESPRIHERVSFGCVSCKSRLCGALERMTLPRPVQRQLVLGQGRLLELELERELGQAQELEQELEQQQERQLGRRMGWWERGPSAEAVVRSRGWMEQEQEQEQEPEQE
jgi:hypothetical protein